MNNEIFDLYNKCFPKLPIRYEAFHNKLNLDHSEKIMIQLHNTLIGVSIISGNAILLLCVLSSFQKQGYGKKLLEQSEERIYSSGYSKVILGYGNTYLMQGVPFEEQSDIIPFFKKFSYDSTWESVDMTMRLSDFDITTLTIPHCPYAIHFRYATEKDKESLLESVSKVDPNWMKYYETSEDPVLLAIENNKILGFAIVSVTDDTFYHHSDDRIGAVGCVGVIPEARKRGIGLRLVANGTNILKEQCCDEAYIGYTHLEHWYSLLGYKTSMRFWMGFHEITI